MNTKWTSPIRQIVYSRITMEFGPFKTWNGETPHNKARYEEVLKELATYLSELTGQTFKYTAVKQQIAWAVTKQTTIKNPSLMRQFVGNKSAALEMGFIAQSELPASA